MDSINILNQTKRKRCKSGTRKNRITGECEPIIKKDVPSISNIINIVPVPVSVPIEVKTRKKRCPQGTRKNRKTKICEPIVSKTKKNKPKIIIVDRFKNDLQPVSFNLKDITNNSLITPNREQELPNQEQEEEPPKLPIQEYSINEEIKDPEYFTNEQLKDPEYSINEPSSDYSDQEDNTTNLEPKNSLVSSLYSIFSTNEKNEKLPEFTKEIEKLSLIENTNEYKKFKEKYEYESNNQADNESNNEYDFLYPDLNDKNFNIKIAQRKEFNDNLYDGKIYDIKKQSNKLCDINFELSPHQIFVKNFLSLQTPYNSLLLYHGLGTGKTCSAIGIAEENRKYMKQIGLKQRIIIIASPNVQDNFRLQLFNESKLKQKNGIWNIQSCVGNTLINEINPTQLNGMTKDKLVSSIKNIINTYYVFMGYIEFSNYASKKINDIPAFISENEREQYIIKNIKRTFNNRLIIVDEVHNIRLVDDNKNKSTAKYLFKIAEYSDNLRLLLLSATPMYNSYKEIIWLVNLLNINDKRSQIKITDIFNKDGNFKEIDNNSDENDRWKENGKSLLIRKLTGYISYVRSENPYSFPIRLYKTNSEYQNIKKPQFQINGNEIKSHIQHIPIYWLGLGELQEKAYSMIVEFIRNDNSFTEEMEKTEIKDIVVPRNDYNLPNEQLIEYDSKDKNTPSSNIKSNLQLQLQDETIDSFGYEKLQIPIQSLNIIYPNVILEQDKIQSKEQISLIVGKKGLEQIMDFQDNSFTKQPEKFNYNYKPGVLIKYGRIFHKDHLFKYSAKIANICDTIRKSSPGIIMIYSQYIDGGIVPISLALEEMGFSRYGSASYTKSLFQKPPSESIDSNTMKTRTELKTLDPKAVFSPARYTIISGDVVFSPNNNEDIKYITSPENKYGEKVKVIIISKAGAEGLDFKNIRQIHIMESWYNMNRIEQIIGRGVRNLSHCSLPFEHRNVEIFLYSSILNIHPEEECADTYVYRMAETKSIQIGRITRLLKETSVDCILNIGQTNFTVEQLNALVQNKNIKIRITSENNKEINYVIGDRPYTDMCDYMENCQYKCYPESNKVDFNNPDKSTYDMDFIRANNVNIIEKIRNLFKEQHFYTRNNIINTLNLQRIYPLEQIYSALSHLLNNKNEFIIDKYDRIGNLINKGDIYAFQPIEITDETISIYERSVPIQYKRNELLIQVPVDFKEDDNVKKISSTINNDIGDYDSTVKNIKNKYESLIEEFEYNYENLTTTPINEFPTAQKKWTLYMNIRILMDHISIIYQIPKELIIKYAIFRMLDSLSLKDKLIILNEHNLQQSSSIDKDKYINSYFEERTLKMKNNNDKVIILSDKDELIIFKQQDETLKWEQQYNTKPFIESLKEFVIPVDKISTIFGFISNGSLKIRDRTGARNKGFDIAQSGKQRSLEILNYFVQKFNLLAGRENKISEYTAENTSKISQLGLCVIVEMILRYLKDLTPRGLPINQPVFFLTQEEMAIIHKYIV